MKLVLMMLMVAMLLTCWMVAITINDYVYCRKAIYILFIASALLSVLRRPCDHCDYDVNAKRNFKIAKL